MKGNGGSSFSAPSVTLTEAENMSDIGMPNEDGFGFVRKLRGLPLSRGGGIPAIALTAYARGEDRDQALNCGFQAHLPKPVELSGLCAVITKVVRREALPG